MILFLVIFGLFQTIEAKKTIKNADYFALGIKITGTKKKTYLRRKI